MTDRLTPEQRSYCMSRIRSKNTKVELIFRKILHAKGFRFRIHYNGLIGKPDIAFTKHKIAIFIDGDFWHGREYEKRKKTYNDFWRRKIERNMERDRATNRKLKSLGWEVFRVWGTEIEKRPEKYVEVVAKKLEGKTA